MNNNFTGHVPIKFQEEDYQPSEGEKDGKEYYTMNLYLMPNLFVFFLVSNSRECASYRADMKSIIDYQGVIMPLSWKLSGSVISHQIRIDS